MLLFNQVLLYAKLLQSCETLFDSMDYSLSGSSVHGISPGKNTGVGCHFHFQGNLTDLGIELVSLASLALAGKFFIPVPPGSHISQVKNRQGSLRTSHMVIIVMAFID